MPDTLQDVVEPTDATGTPNDSIEHADMIMVGLQGHKCDEFDDPEAFGLPEEIAQKVAMVLQGPGCESIYVQPELTAECDTSQPVPVESNIRFDGTMWVMANKGGFDLQQGQLIYEAFRGVCGKFPKVSLKAIGIQLKPGEHSDESVMQARIEPSDLGKMLLRVHIWQGDGRLTSLSGEEFIDLTADMQVLVDQDLNVLQAFSTAPTGQSLVLPEELEPKDQANVDSTGDTSGNHTARITDPGCSVPSHGEGTPDTMGHLFTLVTALWVARVLRTNGLIKPVMSIFDILGLVSGKKK